MEVFYLKYVRMPIEAESPEQFGYGNIKYNLSESSVRDRTLKDMGIVVDDALLYYGDHEGIPKLREVIAKRSGLNSKDVIVTAGASTALFMIATSFLERGDHMVVARPNYATNIETPKAIGADISYLDLKFEEGYLVDPKKLEALIRPNTKYVSLTNYHNPTGTQIPDDVIKEIISIVESKGCYLLMDETYREMAYDQLPVVAATLSDRVISVSSMSKTYGIPGIRIGWLATKNKALFDQFLCAKEQIGICGSVIDEEIAYKMLSQADEWLLENGKHIKRAFEYTKSWIAQEEYMEWVEPKGGVVCFPRVKESAGVDMDKFYTLLLEKYKTYVGPGHWFEQSRNHMRIGFAWPLFDELTAGLANISKALRDAK